MSNSVYIPAQRLCARCNYVGREDADHCKGCGASFKFDTPDAWEIPGPGVQDVDIPDSGLELIKRMMSTQTLTGTPCMWDSVKPGTPMGMVCPCPKCVPYSMGVYTQSGTITVNEPQLS